MRKMLFLDSLRKFLVEVSEHNHLSQSEASGYFETIKQRADDIEYLYNDKDAYKHEFHYNTDLTGGYTNGEICIQLLKSTENPRDYADYHYEIKLLNDPRYFAYCQCTPEDEGYDPMHECCGEGCDWEAPRVEIIKVQGMSTFSFNGIERTLWTAFKKWEADLGIKHENKVQEAIERIDLQLKDLLDTKQSLLNSLNLE